MSPILESDSFVFISKSETQTYRLGRLLGKLMIGGEIIALEGDLGTGKTCLTQGIGTGLGVEEQITSPTFTLVNQYCGRLLLYHIDLYRIGSPLEAQEFGISEYLYTSAVCVIEWAERIASLLPRANLWVTLEHVGENERNISMQATGQRYRRLLEQVKGAGATLKSQDGE